MRKIRGYEVEAITIIENVERKHDIVYIPSHSALESLFAILGGLNLRDDKQRGAFLASVKNSRGANLQKFSLRMLPSPLLDVMKGYCVLSSSANVTSRR